MHLRGAPSPGTELRCCRRPRWLGPTPFFPVPPRPALFHLPSPTHQAPVDGKKEKGQRGVSEHSSFARAFYSERISEVIAKLLQEYNFYLVIT